LESQNDVLPAGDSKFKNQYQIRIDLAKNRVGKTGLSGQEVQLVIAMDFSYSMQSLFLTGVIQNTFDRILPLAAQFNNGGTIDVWVFTTEAFNHAVPYTRENRENFVRKEMVLKYDFGGTEYSPVINKITKKYLTAGKDSPPALVLFFTDGDCSDRDRKDAEDELKIASIRGVFWKFIGINSKTGIFESIRRFFCRLLRIKVKPQGFRFLQKLDRMTGRKVDNANFIHIDDLKNISDEELYSRLLEEFPYWLSEAKKMEIVR